MIKIKKLYEKAAPVLLGEAIIFGLFGIFMFAKPIQILTSLVFIFGIALVLFGVYRMIVGFYSTLKSTSAKVLNVLSGVINILLGVMFLVHPGGSLTTIVYAFAAVFLIKAIISLVLSIQMAGDRFGKYRSNIVMSICLILLAIMILAFPLGGARLIMYYIAGMFLINSVIDFYMYFQLRKLKKSSK